MLISTIGTLDLSSRLARIVPAQGPSIVLTYFTKAMWQSFNHGERVQAAGDLLFDKYVKADTLEVKSIMRLT